MRSNLGNPLRGRMTKKSSRGKMGEWETSVLRGWGIKYAGTNRQAFESGESDADSRIVLQLYKYCCYKH